MAEFWLHYVGKGLYSIEKFEGECARYGCQRAVPFLMLKRFRWGDVVLLAHWLNRDAEVFGYFTVDSVASNLPENVQEKLLSTLNVVNVSAGGYSETRICGSCHIAQKVSVKDTIEEAAEKIEKACEDSNVNPNKHKWFLRGNFTPLKTFILSPAKFTRSYMRVAIENLDLEAIQNEAGALIWIYNYKRRTYLRKKDRESLDMQPLNVWQ